MQAFHAWQSPLSASLKHIGQAKREQITGGQEHHEKKKSQLQSISQQQSPR
jgi:hypothetical protein